MQSKIRAFFEPCSIIPPAPSPLLEDSIEDTPLFNTTQEPEILVTYSRRTTPSTDLSSFDDIKSCLVDAAAAKPATNSGKAVNKKRTYAQFHLELGQSDFQFHNCSICGLKYAPGEEADEEVHKEFHRNYTHGMPFKGWRNERVVPANLSDGSGSRIVLVLDSDPIARNNKIREVAKAMEADLGLSEGWLLHKLCKVYLFISSRRIAGCLVAEPISFGYKLISSSADSKRFNSPKPKATDGSIRTVLQFGNVNFQREVVKRATTVNRKKELVEDQTGAIFCEEEAVPAMCGIRAIWVSPANRRKHVATKLLDAARTSFCTGYVLEHSQLAFSQPTSDGKALASGYCETESFLVYNTGLIA